MIEKLNMSGEISIGDFGEYSTGVDTIGYILETILFRGLLSDIFCQ